MGVADGKVLGGKVGRQNFRLVVGDGHLKLKVIENIMFERFMLNQSMYLYVFVFNHWIDMCIYEYISVLQSINSPLRR